MEREMFKMFKVNVSINADVGWELYREESHGVVCSTKHKDFSLPTPAPEGCDEK